MDHAFGDLSQLMQKAEEMVQLAQYFRERVTAKGEPARAPRVVPQALWLLQQEARRSWRRKQGGMPTSLPAVHAGSGWLLAATPTPAAAVAPCHRWQPRPAGLTN